MITIIDENNLVTEDGVELVASECGTNRLKMCLGCWFHSNNPENCGCYSAPCDGAERTDERDVIFVEKNPC